MIPTIENLFNFIVVCMIFSSMFENGRTEESFECRSELIPQGSTESVNMTCCSTIKFGENYKILWKKYDETLGGCVRYLSDGYTCYSHQSSADRYQTETCGPNCFTFGIVKLSEADYGEYYITLSEGYSILLAKKLVLNLTTLGSDIQHVATTNSSSASTEPTHSASSSMSCSYSDQAIPLLANKRL